MKWRMLRSLALLLSAAAGTDGQDWECKTPACEGHKAGYSWAMSHEVTDQDCNTAGADTNSPSFAEGCKSALQMKREQQLGELIAQARPLITPLIQEYLLGKQLAKELRVLPSECEEAYKAVVESKRNDLATPFRTGCLEVASKQAKKITRERERRAKEAEKQAKKQVQDNAKRAANP